MIRDDEFFRELVDQVRDYAIFAVGRDGRVATWNQGVEHVLGYTEDEFIGLPTAQLFTPEDREAGVPQRELAEAADRGSASDDRWMVRKDGSRIWVVGRTSRRVDDSGAVIGFTKIMRDRTDLKQVRDALRSTEDRYRTLVEAASDAIITIAPDSTILFANAAVTEVFGHPVATLIGQSLTILMPEDQRAAHRAGLERYMRTGERRLDWRRMELPGLHADGRLMRLELSFGETGDGTGLTFTGVIRDVTARHDAEAIIERERELLSAILDGIESGIAACDTNGKLILFNRKTREWHGLPESPIPSGEWPAYYGLYRPDGVTLLDPEELPLARALRGEVIDNVEVVIRPGRAAPRTVVCNGRPMRSPSGALLGAVVVMHDISERKRAEAELQASEERYRLAARATSDVIWDRDLNADRLTWSGALGALLGMPGRGSDEPFESDLEWWRNRLHPEDRGAVESSLRSACAGTAELWQSEYRVRREDGSYIEIFDRGIISRDRSGRAVRMVGALQDLTERRRVEEQLRLMDRIESVGRLAGGVAHESNNQMTVVLGAASFLLRRTDLPPDVRTDLEFVRQAAERTAVITQQLLAYSRRQILQPRVLDLNAEIRDIEPVLRRTLGDRNRLELDLGEDLAPIRADPAQLSQVLLNLTLNARDAMPDGGTLSLTTERHVLDVDETVGRRGEVVRAGPYVRLRVRDTGIGMDDETLARVYEPFFTTKPVGQGSGLGLSSVLGIVRQSGGFIRARSSPGAGATFDISFPAMPDAVAEAGTGAPAVGQAAAGETVLLVEDEALVREMAARTLRSLGYRVLEARNGREALELTRRRDERLDVVVADVVMPEVSGRELADELSVTHPDLPVLFISGHADAEVVRRGLLVRDVPFLQKPFSPDELAAKVRELLESRSAASRRPSAPR